MVEAAPTEQLQSTAPEENVGKKILAGGSWRVLAFVFAALLGIVMTAVVSRHLGPADFALFTTAMSLVTIALSLSDLGLMNLGVREYASKSAEERDVSQRVLIGIRLITSTVTASAIVAFAIWRGYPGDLVWGLVAAGVGICALSVAISYTVPLQATYRLGQVAALEAGRQALQMSLMIVLAIAFENVGWLMAAFLPTGVVIAVAAGLMSRRLAPVTPSFDLRAMRGLLAAAGTFALTAAIGANYPFVAQILSNSVLDSHESGMFSLAFRVFIVGIAAFSAAVGGAFALLVTAVSENDRTRFAFATKRLAESSLLAGTGFAVAMVTGAGFIVSTLGGVSFNDAVTVVAVIGLGYPPACLAYITTMFLLADHQYRALLISASLGATCALISVYLLAREFGAVGAAAGMATGEMIITSAYLTRVLSSERLAFPRPFWVVKVVVIGAVACAVALLPLPSMINMVLGSLAFVCLALLLKLIPPELLHPITSRFGFAATGR